MRAPLIGPFGALLHAPDSPLGRTAEKTWLLSARDCDGEGRFEVLPDSHFGIGVVLAERGCTFLAGGPITERFFASPGDDQIYWIRFRPGLLPRIADVRPADLIDVPGIQMDRLLGIDLDALAEQLHGAPSVRMRLQILDHFLLPLGEAQLCQDRRCRKILEMVDRLDGQINVLGLSREFGLSTRTIQRTLLDQVGLTPKQLIVNVRLQRAVARLKTRQSALPHAQLANDCGYSDQSHMIRDMRRRTGHLPRALEDPVAFVQSGEGPER